MGRDAIRDECWRSGRFGRRLGRGTAREPFWRRLGDAAARKAVHGNRARLRSGVGRAAMPKRAEIVERSFAHIPGRGGMRLLWSRGRENVFKRDLLHAGGAIPGS